MNNNQAEVPSSDEKLLWQDRLASIFKRIDPSYTICESRQLVGLFLCILCKGNARPEHLSLSLVKTGMGGYHGNKGAIAVRFLVRDTAFCIVNSHLAAHQSNISARNTDIVTIMKEASFPTIDRNWKHGGDGSLISVNYTKQGS